MSQQLHGLAVRCMNIQVGSYLGNCCHFKDVLLMQMKPGIVKQ